jgi:hypothetical protein
MNSEHRESFVALVLSFFALVLLCSTAQNAGAQAWVLPKGTGTISVMHQRLDNTAHRRIEGYLDEVGQSINMALYIQGEYAFTDRLSVSAGIPYVFAKSTARNPPRDPIIRWPWDACHCWQSDWQDFGFTARYNVFNGVFALTPSVSYGVPSHDYEFRGESVVGRDLKEVQFSVDVGRRLDAISENLSVQGRYSYAVVEEPIDIPDNRSNARWEAAYQVTRKLSTYGFVSWQHTHGGLSFGSPQEGAAFAWPGDVNTPERVAQHDRLMRDNYWHTGGGASYGFQHFDVFGSYTAYVAGTDTHAGRALTAGISFPFETRLGHKEHSTQTRSHY